MNEGQSENLFLFGMHRGWGSGWSLYFLFFFAARSLNKEDENACIELIGNWKYFGICYFSIGCFVKLKLEIFGRPS